MSARNMFSVFRRPPLTQALGLLAWLGLCALAAAAGAAASVQAGSFYAALQRPDWAPPGWLFGPVWTALYVLMALAAWQVWRAAPLVRSGWALPLFVAQLALNALWTWLFFGWQLGAWAFADVLALWLLILLCVLSFARVSRRAAALLLPYLAWVSFASVLTWAVWRANPGVLG